MVCGLEARLRGAAQTVRSRLERLSQLQAALGQTNAFDQSLISASANMFQLVRWSICQVK
tara:strand:- start:524 stop:703 length:180 start_codon:yes stop_codon:yes gene_type:complete